MLEVEWALGLGGGGRYVNGRPESMMVACEDN
jgi:hypothetical protein